MLLLERPVCACEIAAVFCILMSTVSRHLKEMTYAGIVKGEKEFSFV